MEHVPVGLGVEYEVGVGQYVEDGRGAGLRDVEERGGGLRGDLVARPDPAEQAEGPRGLAFQGLVAVTHGHVAHGEGPLDVEGAHGEGFEAALVGGESFRQERQGPGGAGGQLTTDDVQGEWQAPAGGHDVGQCLRLVAYAIGPGECGEQRVLLGLRQRGERDLDGAGQVGEQLPAGDEGGAPPACGEQGRHMGGVARVVEDQQDAALGERGAQEEGAVVRVLGEGVVVDAEVREEAGEQLVGGARAIDAVTAQVGVEGSVREGLAHPVGDVDGEGGLADAAHAGDDDGSDGGGGLRGAVGVGGSAAGAPGAGAFGARGRSVGTPVRVHL